MKKDPRGKIDSKFGYEVKKESYRAYIFLHHKRLK